MTAALVRAIRRAHPGDVTVGGGIVSFHVTDIHDFARRLVEQGVRAE
ncbi:MAG TPA: hypothetical protein VGR09_12490 [Gemmatimonadales bacterium]|nr:hypothetical protein [Gemmatimonadales bacterium]